MLVSTICRCFSGDARHNCCQVKIMYRRVPGFRRLPVSRFLVFVQYFRCLSVVSHPTYVITQYGLCQLYMYCVDIFGKCAMLRKANRWPWILKVRSEAVCACGFRVRLFAFIFLDDKHLVYSFHIVAYCYHPGLLYFTPTSIWWLFEFSCHWLSEPVTFNFQVN